jgi:hypothetical protein
MRVSVSQLAVAFLLSFSSVWADSNLDQATQQQLSRLELKYFGRNYAAESDESRAQRLEKLVFGDAVEGDPAKRIQNIVAGTGGDNVANPPAPSATARQPDYQPDNEDSIPPQPSPVNSVAHSSKEGEDPYPHVTELENAILGHSYAGQQLTGRISRMEVKAFGRSSADPDLSSRTDALEQYAEEKLHKRTEIPAETEVTTENSPSTAPQTDYPKIDALEVAILGQSYPGQQLPDRLSHMESKAFGSPSPNPDLSQRTDALERYAEKTLHKKLPDQRGSGTDTADSGSSKQGQLLSKIGKTLLGMAGSSVGGMGFGPGMIGSGYGPGMMGSGYGPGFGRSGGMGMGTGQPRASQRQGNDPKEEEKSESRIEDPAIIDSSPPAPNARLITKIGWCEMQVFNHTSPTMHLEQRLAQLNEEINFAPGKSNIELMDHVGDLMKKVVALKQPGKPVAAKTQSVVR